MNIRSCVLISAKIHEMRVIVTYENRNPKPVALDEKLQSLAMTCSMP